MNDPRTWTTVWGLTVGVRGGGKGRGEQWVKIRTTVIEQQQKKRGGEFHVTRSMEAKCVMFYHKLTVCVSMTLQLLPT